ncbi:DUF262 domain-containing protein [Bradyrhizobium sp. AUGA SZCCT0274]|uniref:DUF262 domain-containing protein n=1 Tax=Bradyrhizobium sp. AUGA SZCCT0274 TaxID=2807670 RepID=UPI001BA48812|nr:DUF262 domain-containing protein [Bradyrhizobium sp. AUGA SZCCT0274]MBR1240290.1 DUF262 domain-containing protein [Bradyrhizobium sp. AUGA SZCCT0274]
MSIMQQSSKAQDRTLGVWFQQIQQGQIKLPRFQRLEAWDRARVTSFLNTIINNLPVGVTLALEVAGKEKFISRYISSAEPIVPGTVTQHLLDGQQRLTAFWRSVHNNYEWESYFVYLPEFDRDGEASGEVAIRCVPRWINKNELRMPRWAEDPAQCLERGLVPLSLLRPEDISGEIEGWVKTASLPLKPKPDEVDAFAKLEDYNAFQDRLKSKISTLRERVKFFNLPYLSLPAETEKEVALQVFINMNTNSKPLSLYDIIVAEVESVNEESLHEREASLHEKCPHAARYGEIRDLILSTSALLQDQLPNNRGMIDMNKKVLVDNWPKLERGLERMAAFLAGQGIFDQARLPTNAVLAVIAASYEFIPDNGDFLAKAERLLRRYMWSAFFTDRYENTAATRAFADFKAIKGLLQRPQFAEEEELTVPVLNRSEYQLANADSLMAAGWPKGVGIEARGILAVTTYLGAYDFADNKRASYESVQDREYHHVFPDALLCEAEINSSLALNCALITWKTNRTIGRKDPLAYLQERVAWADAGVVADRLKSHLISFDLLSKAHYADLEGTALKEKLAQDFEDFLRDRARLVVAAMESLAAGANPSIEALWSSHQAANGSVAA